MSAFAPLDHETVLARVSLHPEGEVGEARAYRLLAEDERVRADRFLVPAPRRRYVFARAALRRCLGAALGLEPEEVALREGLNGRPELAGALDGALVFNLAHSGDTALLAWAREGALGIDVEVLRPIARLTDIAAEVLGSDEYEDWKRHGDGERAFLVAWTRKEAALKATGLGLSGGLRELDVRGATPLVVNFLDRELCIEDLDVPGHVAALAASPAVCERRWVTLPD